MKQSFEELYETIKASDSPELEEIYQNAKKERKIFNTWFGIFTVLFAAFMIWLITMMSAPVGKHSIYHLFFNFWFLIIPFSLIEFVLYTLFAHLFLKNTKKYKAAYKIKVIKKLLCNFYDDVNYYPDRGISKTIYDEANYKEYYNEYHSDDYMESKINNHYPIQMAEVHTIDVETHRDSDGSSSTTRTTKFHGLFAKIGIDKSINSSLLIRRNLSFFGKKKLDMDSQEFEKMFDVSSSNQIIGMQLLTHDIMELLISFKKSTGITYDISIYNNTIYLRFHTSTTFELKSFKKGAFDEEVLRKYYNIVDFTYTLSKMLIDLIDKTEL